MGDYMSLEGCGKFVMVDPNSITRTWISGHVSQISSHINPSELVKVGKCGVVWL